MMENFIQSQSKVNQMLKEGLMQHEENFKRIDAKLEQLATHTKMLENKITSQASIFYSWQIGKFPSQPENPKEHMNVITLWSGK